MPSKTSILITGYSLEVGGIERSLIGLLSSFDYSNYDVDLLLYKHQGPFMAFLPTKVNLLPEIPEYVAAVGMPLKNTIMQGNLCITAGRVAAKLAYQMNRYRNPKVEQVHYYGQKIWQYTLPKLPRIKKSYDIAISFSDPHHCITDRVDAKLKLGWIHTDYNIIDFDEKQEMIICNKLNYIVAVSDACRVAFLNQFPQFAEKTIVIENILSSDFVRQQSLEFDVGNEMPQDDGIIRILTVGRFCYQKAFDDAVYACHKLIEIGYNIRWYAIGYGPDEEKMRKVIFTKGLKDNFIILGKKSNPYPYMRASDIYVQPSRYEGKAVTVREAQILGKPVMITRFSTSGSQVEEGVDGHICELGVKGIVSGVQRLLNDSDYRKRIAATSALRDYSNCDEVKKIYTLLV